MKLIKWNFWVLKEHNNFSYLWKFEPDIQDSYGEILFEKPQNLERIYELINVLPPINSTVSNCCYFLLLIAKSWNLHKLYKITSSFYFKPNWYIFYGLTRMLMSKSINNDVTMNPPTVEPPCATTSPKHQNLPCQSLTVGTSCKRPPPVTISKRPLPLFGAAG